jgi:hypothetical protein
MVIRALLLPVNLIIAIRLVSESISRLANDFRLSRDNAILADAANLQACRVAALHETMGSDV